MADPETTETIQQGGEKAQSRGGALLSWLMPVLAAVLCAGGGFAAGRLFGASGNTQNVSAAESPSVEAEVNPQNVDDADADPVWFFDMESIVANLNEPGGTRYVRVGLTLGIGRGLKEKEGQPLLERKLPFLKNWLTLFMANQTVNDVTGEANLRKVQDQITDAFNKGVFGNGQSHIKQVYFKELSIQ